MYKIHNMNRNNHKTYILCTDAQNTYEFDFIIENNEILIEYCELKFKIPSYESLQKYSITTINKIVFLSIPISQFKKIENELEKNYLMYFFKKKILVSENYIVEILKNIQEMLNQ